MKSNCSRDQLWDPSIGIIFAPSVLQTTELARSYSYSRAWPRGPSTAKSQEPEDDDEPLNVHEAMDKLIPEHKAPEATEFDPYADAPYEDGNPDDETSASALYDDDAASSANTNSSSTEGTGTEATSELDAAVKAIREWKIPDDIFEAAKDAAVDSKESFWTYRLYRGPPEEDGSERRVKVHYCRSKHTMERVCQEYFVNEPVIGFDQEWLASATRRHGIRKNVSLIQVCSPSHIALFHVALFEGRRQSDFVAPTFKQIMENPGVTKCGVWIKGDASRLHKNLGVRARGLMELSHLYRLVKYSKSNQPDLINKKLVPLSIQAQDSLGLPLFKGSDVRTSDWSKPLNMDQVTYSGSDAYTGLHIYGALENMRMKLVPCPPRPAFAESAPSRRLVETSARVFAGDEDLIIEDNYEPRDDMEVMVDKAYREAGLVIKEARTKLKSLDPRYNASTAWAEVFLKENRNPATSDKLKAATRSELRAYHIWHTNRDLSPEDIAGMLRVKPKTVCSYVLSVVQKEGLPVNQNRYEAQILAPLGLNTRPIS